MILISPNKSKKPNLKNSYRSFPVIKSKVQLTNRGNQFWEKEMEVYTNMAGE